MAASLGKSGAVGHRATLLLSLWGIATARGTERRVIAGIPIPLAMVMGAQELIATIRRKMVDQDIDQT